MTEILERLRMLEEQQFGKGATLKEVELAEIELGVKFPTDYAAFLKEFGWGGASHWEIYGLGSDVPRNVELVRLTLSERSEMSPRLPERLLPIYNDGFGNLSCLDTAAMKDGRCPVVFWDHDQDEDQFPEIEANSFNDWLAALIDS
jgi:cell wall assembly regulator SMI1